MAESEDVKERIIECTYKSIDEISRMWSQMFDSDTCSAHLQKFERHVQRFYDDLIKETEDKKGYILGDIRALQKEAITLQRALQINKPLLDLPVNIPLTVTQAAIDSSLEEMRAIYSQREKEVTEMLLQQEVLIEELGETPLELLCDPLPSEEEVNRFRRHLVQLETLQTERMDRLIDLRAEIKRYMRTLEATPSSQREDLLLNQRLPKLDAEAFEQLHKLRDHYRNKVEKMQQDIDEMIAKIEKLWKRLQESDDLHKEVIRKKVAYTQEAFKTLEAELARCEMLWRLNIKSYVEQLRLEIREYWEKLLLSGDDCNRFQHLNNDCYTEDLLLLHEMELDDLKLLYQKNKQIYQLFTQRSSLWDRMNALESKANEPGRYNNRGGQLLKEERERKTIAKKLPKIEEEISELVQIYESREGKPFKVYGENIIDYMAAGWEQKRKEKELMSSARKQIRTPLASNRMTPSTRTPMSLKNMSKMTASTTSLRCTPCSNVKINSCYGSAVSAHKRKLEKKDTELPNAKRNLLESLKPPSTFIRPNNVKNKTQAKKSPVKKVRVLASNIQRISNGRLSNSRRRSARKANSRTNIPRIIVDTPSSSEGVSESAESNDDTYASFEKCIEPSSRSSTIVEKISNRMKTRAIIAATDSAATSDAIRGVAALPNQRTTSTDRTLATLQNKTTQSSTGRKLTTKNLPIII